MKTLKFIAGAVLCSFLVVSSVFATDNESVLTASQIAVREQIVDVISANPTNQSGEVTISFNASAKNGFTLFGVKGNNVALNFLVEDALNDANIAIPPDLEGDFKLAIKINLPSHK